MNKTAIIQKHFQKVDQLTIENSIYKKCVNDLCEWLLRNDAVQKDLTTKLLFPKSPDEIRARIFSKQELTVAGVEEVIYLLNTFSDIRTEIKTDDGKTSGVKQTILELHGRAAEILAYERTVINLLQRLSGIATVTKELDTKIKKLQLPHPPLIAATRKTQWTLLDKKAVALGGGGTHRLTLSDGVLVKDNHLLILKQIYNIEKEPDLAEKTFQILSEKVNDVLIEIEVEEKESIEKLILLSNATKHTNTLCILLDNFSAKEIKATLNDLNNKYDLSNIIFEASGGITKDTITDWAATGVDVISLGAITHSPHAMDISLEIIEPF